MNSEQVKDDLERGMIHNCLLSLDLQNLLSHLDVIPEFEPQADSLWTGFPAIRVGKIHPFVFLELSHFQNSKSILPTPGVFNSRMAQSARSVLDTCIFVSVFASENI